MIRAHVALERNTRSAADFTKHGYRGLHRMLTNLRAVQLLLGHTKIESTVRYLGIEVDDALAIAEQVDV
jgi:integrase